MKYWYNMDEPWKHVSEKMSDTKHEWFPREVGGGMENDCRGWWKFLELGGGDCTTLNPLNRYHFKWLKFRILCEFYLNQKGKKNLMCTHIVGAISLKCRFWAGPEIKHFWWAPRWLLYCSPMATYWVRRLLGGPFHCAALKFWASGASPLEPTPAPSISANKNGGSVQMDWCS